MSRTTCTEQTTPPPASPPAEPKQGSWGRGVDRRRRGRSRADRGTTRARAPSRRASPIRRSTGAPRPVELLFGYDHWLDLLQIFTIITMSHLIAVLRRRRGGGTRGTPSC